MDSRTIENELIELERRGWDSLCDGTGHCFYGELLTDDGLFVLAHGEVVDREGVIASLDGAPTWDSYRIEDARVVRIGEGQAALVYWARAERAGAPPFVAMMSSVYLREDGRWRMALYQQTPVPGAS